MRGIERVHSSPWCIKDISEIVLPLGLDAHLKTMTHQPIQLLSRVGSGPVGVGLYVS